MVFTVGSPPSGTTPPQGPRTTMFSGEDRQEAPQGCRDSWPESYQEA